MRQIRSAEETAKIAAAGLAKRRQENEDYVLELIKQASESGQQSVYVRRYPELHTMKDFVRGLEAAGYIVSGQEIKWGAKK